MKILNKKVEGRGERIPELHYLPLDILLIQHKQKKAMNRVQIDRPNLLSSSMKKASRNAFAPQKQLGQTFSNEHEKTEFSPKFYFSLTYNAEGNYQARGKKEDIPK